MATDSTKAEVQANVTCLCGAVKDKVALSTTLPIASMFCHCNICRRTSGTLFLSGLPLPEPPQSVQKLSRYDSSDRVSRYFCRTCGTHIYLNNRQKGIWAVMSGTVDGIVGNEQVSSCKLQQIAQHQFVGDTGDGGLAVCLIEPSDSPTPTYMQRAGSEVVDTSSKTLLSNAERPAESEARMKVACHCGGVEFFLTRPNEASRACSSPWPDLLRPYHSHDPANPDDEKWWLRGSTKYLAGTCACRTCRLGHSSPITCWAFIPRTNLVKGDGTTMTFDTGTMQNYQSSEGRTRGFCSSCGASVFLRIDERPDLIDISLGLCRAAEGSRAETWFDWVTTRVSFAEEAFDGDLVAKCESGLGRLGSNTA